MARAFIGSGIELPQIEGRIGGDDLGEHFDRESDVFGGAAAGKIGDEGIETLQKGAGDSEASDLFEGFIEEIAGVQVGGDEDVCAAGDWGIGEFRGGDFGI